MTDAKSDKEILAMALRKVYSSPQAAFMDGSYNRVREAIILGIKEARREARERMMKLWAQEYGNDNVCNDCYKLFLDKLEELSQE